jgi:hypothetical protein
MNGSGQDDHERDESVVEPDDTEGSNERPVERFRRSAAGTVVAAGLLGLRDALEGRPEKEEPAMIAEGPERVAPDNLEVFVDFEHPERSVAIVRRSGDADGETTEPRH